MSFRRSRRFTRYIEKTGFRLDVDHSAGEDFRVVQLTPPGSACAIALMRNTALTSAGGADSDRLHRAGSLQGLHLVVSDIDAARAELIARGTEVSEVFHFGPEGQTPGPDPQRGDYNSFATFTDPDGNGWLLQEVRRTEPAA
jgi:hypothetical protein